ncbi:MAG: NmrA family NAD(P)-binding protein [Terracidiphilus sp.]
MSHPILITGAAGGQQGSTGRVIATLLLEQGLPVRAFVHKLDARSDELRQKGAEIVAGDLLNPASVRAAMKDVKRAYFTFPVADGLLEAATIFAATAREAGLELIVNNSQFQGTPGDPAFRDLQHAPSFRNLQHRLADRLFDWAGVGAIHLQTPPFYENVRALVSRSVAEKSAAFLPWGDGDAVIPLAGAEDVARVAATLLAASGAPSEKVYPLVSETLTVRQIVATLGNAIGRPIRYVPITDEQWADAVKERINPHALDHLTHLWQYFRNSKERRQATNAVREITGRSPQTLEEFFRANANSFGAAVQWTGHPVLLESNLNL